MSFKGASFVYQSIRRAPSFSKHILRLTNHTRKVRGALNHVPVAQGENGCTSAERCERDASYSVAGVALHGWLSARLRICEHDSPRAGVTRCAQAPRSVATRAIGPIKGAPRQLVVLVGDSRGRHLRPAARCSSFLTSETTFVLPGNGAPSAPSKGGCHGVHQVHFRPSTVLSLRLL